MSLSNGSIERSPNFNRRKRLSDSLASIFDGTTQSFRRFRNGLNHIPTRGEVKLILRNISSEPDLIEEVTHFTPNYEDYKRYDQRRKFYNSPSPLDDETLNLLSSIKSDLNTPNEEM